MFLVSDILMFFVKSIVRGIKMANKGNKYKVGLLTIIFLVLLVICLMSLGIMKYFQPKISFMTATTETVQGLSVGAKVKIKGVTIGQVSKIQLSAKGRYIYIFMEFDQTSFAKQSDLNLSMSEMREYFNENLQKMINEGVRCQLQYEGITGSMFVEIRKFNLKRYPVTPEFTLPPNPPIYIPSIPQASIGNMLEDAQIALKKIGKVDFEKISNQMDGLLTAGNDMIKSKKIEKIINEIGAISLNLKNMTNSFNAVINEKRITELTDNINNGITDFRLLSVDARETMQDADIPGLIKTTKTLIRNTDLLIKYIDMNPNALLMGRSGHSVVPTFIEKK